MIYKGRIAILYFVIRDGLFTDSYTVHLKDLNIPSTICDRPDLSAGARPTHACGTGTTIEEVDEHSSPHALTIMTTLRMTIPDTDSRPADFHPHPTIT